MKNANNIAISNARQFADITTLLAAAKSADEAREIFRERYPSDREQSVTPPEGEANEPKFWLNLIETAKELKRRCLHFDCRHFDLPCEFILASDIESEGREILYTGKLRDGRQGVIYLPQVIEVYDDRDRAVEIENFCDGKFYDNAGSDPHDKLVDYSDGFGDGAPFHTFVNSTPCDLELGDDVEQAVAEILRRIDRDLIGEEVGLIRSDLLLCAICDRDVCDPVLPVNEAIEKFKTAKLGRWDSIAVAIDDETVLDLTDPYFAAWLLENLNAD